MDDSRPGDARRASAAATRVRPLRTLLGIGAAVLVVLGLATALLLGGLDAYPLWDPDEGRHALIARNLLGAQEWRGWMLPQLYGRPYYDKPILYYWLTALAYALGGTTTFAARCVSAGSGIVTVALVFGLALVSWGVAAALAAGAVLVTAFGFLALGRFSSLDMLLTACLTLALVALRRTSDGGSGNARWLLVGAATGLGMLAKGAVAPVLVVGIGVVDRLASGRWRSLRRDWPWGAALAFVVVAAPWYGIAGWLDPAYLRDFFIEQHVTRFLGAGAPHMHPAPFWMTPVFALAAFLPWTFVLPAVAAHLRERGLDGAQRFCLCWAGVVLVFFSCSSGKLATYVLPALPALALLTGSVVGDALLAPSTRRLLALGVRGAGLIWVVAAGVVLLGAGLLPSPPTWAERTLVAMLSVGGASALWAIGGRVCRPSGLVASMVAVVVLTALTFYGVVAPRLEDRFSDAHMARMIAHCDPQASAPVLVWGMPHASLAFYLDRPARRVDRIRELRRVLARRQRVFVVANPGQVETLQRLTGNALAVVVSGRHALLTERAMASTPVRTATAQPPAHRAWCSPA